MNIKSALILSLLAAAIPVAAGTVEFGYTYGSTEYMKWGAKKAQTYNVAIAVDNPALTGGKITAVDITMPPLVTATDYSVFLTSELRMSGGKPVVDISSQTFTANPAGTTHIVLDNPYTITDKPLYVGYSFTIANVSNENDPNAKPVAIVPCDGTEGSFYVSTSRTYRKWNTPANTKFSAAAISVEIEGDFSENAAFTSNLTNIYGVPGQKMAGNVTIVNAGSKPVSDVDLQFTVNDNVTTQHITLTQPIAAYIGKRSVVPFELAPIDKLGLYEASVQVLKVNGVENNTPAAPATAQVCVADELPNRCVVMDEYTGTWCGWCPRGWMAMELLNKEYGSRYAAISFHNGDIMQVTEDYPVEVDGFPMADVNRSVSCDPYTGAGNTPMGIRNLIDDYLTHNIPANMWVKAKLADDNNTIKVESSAYFFTPIADNPYLISYAVTVDGLGCHDPEDPEYKMWLQHSYFPGETGYGPEMDMFTKGPEYLDLTYNDVYVGGSAYNGVEGSLPASVESLQRVNHSTEFMIDSFVSTYEKAPEGYKLVKDPKNLNVVAILVNSRTGEIVNAAKTRIGSDSGLKAVNSDTAVIATEYYDLSGCRLKEAPRHGVAIRVDVKADGSRTVRKLLAR